MRSSKAVRVAGHILVRTLILSFLLLPALAQTESGTTDGLGVASPDHLEATKQRNNSTETIKLRIAGLNVVVWEPKALKTSTPSPAPLVIFSHGYHGFNGQTVFLMKALAQAGYLVIAPNHKDAITNGISSKQMSFFKISSWSSNTYRDREEDIKTLVNALHSDPVWNSKIDWTKFALAGHSLGGYTVLGLAGAWTDWKLPGVKAVLALSPYTNPFLKQETLDKLDVPVMYQSGTRDIWINPFLKNRNGAFNHTPSPAEYVELKHAGHFAWSNLNGSRTQRELISHYCIEFLDKYVLARKTAKPDEKLDGVASLQAK